METTSEFWLVNYYDHDGIWNALEVINNYLIFLRLTVWLREGVMRYQKLLSLLLQPFVSRKPDRITELKILLYILIKSSVHYWHDIGINKLRKIQWRNADSQILILGIEHGLDGSNERHRISLFHF